MATNRFTRRVVSIPLALGLALLLTMFAAVLYPIAFVADLFVGFRRKRVLRGLAMVHAWLGFEVVGIAIAAAMWVASGFGLLERTDTFQRRYYQFQVWWAGAILAVFGKLAELQLEIGPLPPLEAGPYVAVIRHASFPDALLPSVVFGQGGLHPRHTLKSELQWSPSLDLVGGRLPHHFIDREPADRDAELAQLTEVAGGAKAGEVALIFPEGTFPNPQRRERALARIEATQPERLPAVEGLKHTLPIRPGGTIAMLEAAPDADLLVLVHSGLEPFGTIAGIAANVPAHRKVRAELWRIDRSTVPTDPAALGIWLDDLWQQVDDWLSSPV